MSHLANSDIAPVLLWGLLDIYGWRIDVIWLLISPMFVLLLLTIRHTPLCQHCACICPTPVNYCPLPPSGFSLHMTHHRFNRCYSNKFRSVEGLVSDWCLHRISASRVPTGQEECEYVEGLVWCPRRSGKMADPEGFHLPIVYDSSITHVHSLHKARLYRTIK